MKLTPEMEKWTPEQWVDHWHNVPKLTKVEMVRLARLAAYKQALEEAALFAEDGVEGWQNGKYFDAVTPGIIAEGIRALISKY